MSKKMFKRSLALGALMAFVITGQAWAAEILNTDTDLEQIVTISGNNINSSYVSTNMNGKNLTIVSDDKSAHAYTVGVEGYSFTGGGNLTIDNQFANDSGYALYGFGNIVVADLSIKAIQSNAVYASGLTKIIANNIALAAAGSNGNAITVDTNESFTMNAADTISMIGGNRVIRVAGGADTQISAKSIYLNTDKDGKMTNSLKDNAAIKVDGNSKLTVNAEKFVLNATFAEADKLVSDVGSNLVGVWAAGNGTINIFANDIDIDVVAENGKAVHGVRFQNEGSHGIIGKAGANVDIYAKGAPNNNYVNGVLVFNVNSDSDKSTNSTLELIGNSVNIKAEGTSSNAWVVGVNVGNDTNNTDGKKNTVIINANDTHIEAIASAGNENIQSSGLMNYSDGVLQINNGNLTVVSKVGDANGMALQTRGNATTEINKDNNSDYTVKLTGDIGYATSASDGQLDNAMKTCTTINLANDKSFLEGNIIKVGVETEVNPEGMTLGLSGGANWTTVADENGEKNFVNTLNMNGGILNVAEGTKVQVGVNAEDTGWDGVGTVVLENTGADQVTLNKKQAGSEVTVATNIVGIDNMTDEEIADELAKLQGAVVEKVESEGTTTATKEGADYAAHYGESALYDEVKIAMEDLQGDNAAAALNKTVASANVSVNDMVAIGMMSWRAEMNDMNKRMGELRNANGEHGVWVRMVRGESEYNSVKNQYNQYQLGYDEKLSVDKRWTVGMALSYTDAENNFAQGNGESTNKALSVYGSKLNDDGTFIDLIAKYARLENEFTVQSGQGDADYDTNAYSFSAEVGKRIQQGNGLWIEPQVELTYGKVSAVDYVTKNNVKVAQDGMESLVGRVGFSLGKDIEKGNVYARASYLYDFDGETKAVLNGVQTLENDLGGGWWEVGVGANINLSKATYIYADVEKTFGGEVDTNWQWNLGVRYSF